MKPFTHGLEQLICLLRGKNKRHDGVFLEMRDISKGVVFVITAAYKKLKKGACSRYMKQGDVLK